MAELQALWYVNMLLLITWCAVVSFWIPTSFGRVRTYFWIKRFQCIKECTPTYYNPPYPQTAIRYPIFSLCSGWCCSLSLNPLGHLKYNPTVCVCVWGCVELLASGWLWSLALRAVCEILGGQAPTGFTHETPWKPQKQNLRGSQILLDKKNIYILFTNGNLNG